MRIDDWPPESEAAWVSRRKLLMLASSALIVLPSACNRPSDSTDSLYPKAIEHNSGEMIYWSATAIARAILEKRISSEEVVKAYLARIQAVNPKINAVVQLRAEDALADAERADASLARGEIKGSLHGVPITIKDSFDTEGVVSTGGTKGRAHYVPAEDATVVARLKAAGAILLGKTNTPELTFAWETDNLVYGRTNNPYNIEKSPGGSSGGAAAILASGGSALDIGSDTGGSIRLPSHFCGTVGIRPTSGRVPRTGHIISYIAGAEDAFTQIGPMARFVEDLILTLPIIAGVDWRDPAIVPMPLGNPREVNLKSLKVSFHTDNGIVTPTPEIMATIRNAAKACADIGCAVEEKRPTGIEKFYPLLKKWELSDTGLVDRLLKLAGTTERGPFLKLPEKPPKPMLLTEYGEFLEQVDSFRSEMLGFLKDYDVILCPVNAHVALPHGAAQKEAERGAFTYTQVYSITGWPGAVVRGGTSPEGLPIGVEIIGRPWREDVVLAVAAHIESVLGGFHPPSL